MAKTITGLFLTTVLAFLILNPAVADGESDLPKVLSIRERVDLVNKITLKRLDLLIPKFMRATGGLTVVLKNRLIEVIGPVYAARLESAEPLVTLWAETLLEEEIRLMERAAVMSNLYPTAAPRPR